MEGLIVTAPTEPTRLDPPLLDGALSSRSYYWVTKIAQENAVSLSECSKSPHFPGI